MKNIDQRLDLNQKQLQQTVNPKIGLSDTILKYLNSLDIDNAVISVLDVLLTLTCVICVIAWHLHLIQ